MARKSSETPFLDINLHDLEAMCQRFEAGTQTPEDCILIRVMVTTLAEMTRLCRERGTTIARLRSFLSFTSSEKLAKTLDKLNKKRRAAANANAPNADAANTPAPTDPDSNATAPRSDAPATEPTDSSSPEEGPTGAQTEEGPEVGAEASPVNYCRTMWSAAQAGPIPS